MKTSGSIRVAAIISIVLSLLFVNAEESEKVLSAGLRTWTSKKGDTIKASYEKTTHGSVYLKNENGKTIKIKKTALSSADQAVVDKLSQSAISKALAARNTNSSAEAPPEIYDMFGKRLRTANNKPVSADTLTDKVIGVYFSAHWCPPCRAFTPKLVSFYDKLKADDQPFEIVFVSSDRSKEAMYAYMKETKMKWLALPYGDKRKNLLSNKFGVSGIPMLVILNSKGEVITKNGRGGVTRGAEVFNTWNKQK